VAPVGGGTLADRFAAAVEAGDAAQILRLAAENPGLARLIDQPRFAFATPALVFAAGRRDRELVDALLDAGADPDARSEWEAGPYSALHSCVDGPTAESLALAEHLATRGATIDLHAAAGMARLDLLEVELNAAPSRVNEPGPDGATPLHLAANPEVARLLLDRGADLEQRCVDHRSTPLMWSVQGRELVTRFLVEAGARPDLFIAAVLNDVSMAERILDDDPEAIGVSVRFGTSHDHLGQGDKYVWALEFADTPHEVARRRGHDEVYEVLLRRSPPSARLVQACRRGDVAAVRELLAADPALPHSLSPHDAREALIAGASTTAVLLEAGMDPNRRDPDGATALHHAAWRGDRPLVELLLAEGADPAILDRTHTSAPLGWADHNHQTEIVDLLRRQLSSLPDQP
jgi:ankyrin repeat protein